MRTDRGLSLTLGSIKQGLSQKPGDPRIKLGVSASLIFTAALVGGLLLQQYFAQALPQAEITLLATETGGPEKPYSFNGTNPTITVSINALVRVKLLNTGSAAHDFAIDELAVHLFPDVEPGHEGEVTFRAAREGNFQYICTVPGHKELGMQGTLTIAS